LDTILGSGEDVVTKKQRMRVNYILDETSITGSLSAGIGACHCQDGNGKEQHAAFGLEKAQTLTLHFTVRGLSRPTATRQEKPKKSKTGPKTWRCAKIRLRISTPGLVI
jgi:hypothetical protein